MDTSQRNQKIKELTESFFSEAESNDNVALTQTIADKIEVLFQTTTWGFREILLVIVLARLVDDSYFASKSFYKCNPRALYEGPIRTVLLKRGIPHKKSGPLNIAKATNMINHQWSSQRRPADVAQVVVELVEYLEKLNQSDLRNFALYLHKRFLTEAKRIETLRVTVNPNSDPIDLFLLMSSLIKDVPDAGNTPQRIIGYLLQSYHDEIQTGIKVSGHEDRASVTNTTSKKPGDIVEEQLDGTILKIYEITVKPFSDARIIESYEAVKAYDLANGTQSQEIMVICRKEDIPSELIVQSDLADVFLGKVEYQDITYYFSDVFEFIFESLLRMTTDSRLSFYRKMQDYIFDPNTSEKVKVTWKDLVSK